MATIDEVTLAIANQIQLVVYPTGLNNPAIVSVDVAIFQGWPNPKTLDDFVAKAGNVMISIYPSELEKNTTRGLGNTWYEVSNNGTTGDSVKETKRQEKQIQVTVWTNIPELRNVVTGTLDAELAEVYRFKASDGYSNINMSYTRSLYTDDLQNEGLYRGDLFYGVEYPSTIVRTDQVVQHVTVTVKEKESDTSLFTQTT